MSEDTLSNREFVIRVKLDVLKSRLKAITCKMEYDLLIHGRWLSDYYLDFNEVEDEINLTLKELENEL